MITFKSGNLFDSKCQTLVNTVNTFGVMGKGIALEFKKRYPKMFYAYKTWCNVSKHYGGSLMWYHISNNINPLFPLDNNEKNCRIFDFCAVDDSKQLFD